MDGSGNVYVTGYTESTTFPTTSGVYRTTCSTCSFSYPDVFVTKLSPAGAIVYSTYVGDDNTSDKGYGIAVDSSGNAYVTGETFSGSSAGFPIVNGFPFTSGNSGAIVFKLDSSGTALLYSTRLQSGSSAIGYGIAVEGSNAYVAGMAVVANQEFPLWSLGGTNHTVIGTGGSYDAFIVKIDTTATGVASLSYATRLGGSSWEYAYAVAVDSSGSAYVTGEISSGYSSREVLVVKFNPAGDALLYSTSIGGAADEYGYGIAVDSAGNAYITGSTASSDFPVTTGVFQSASGGGTDAFAAKLNPAGVLLYSTYIGGSSSDIGRGIALDSAGNAYLAGDTSSSNFPVTANAMQAARNGTNTDAFVTVLNPTGAALAYSSYLGGSGNVAGGDKAYGITVDSSGNVIVVGQTDSANFPMQSAFQTTHSGGNFDAFVAKIRDDGSSGLTVTKSGTGSGTVTSSPAGINCGADCTESYASGTSVTLTATPASGSTFTGWSGGGCSGTGTCQIVMNANTTVTATFDTVSGGGGGSSGGGGGGGGCGSIDDSSNGEPPASTMILLFLPLIWLFFRKRFVKIEAE